jgi:hypothetical protein
VYDKGARAEANESTFKGNCRNGVVVWNQASVQLEKCRAGSNKLENVGAASGAVVSLTCCTVADSLEQSGLAVSDEGTRVEANESTIEGNCRMVVEVWNQASFQLDKCTGGEQQAQQCVGCKRRSCRPHGLPLDRCTEGLPVVRYVWHSRRASSKYVSWTLADKKWLLDLSKKNPHVCVTKISVKLCPRSSTRRSRTLETSAKP